MNTTINSILVIITFLISSFAYSQSQVEENLTRNMATMDEFQNVLASDYISMTDLSNVIPKNSFVLSNLMVLNSYGDVSMQEMAKTIEDQFSAAFNGSTWKFDEIDKQNGSQKLNVNTASEQTESSTYSCSGATFHAGFLIEGMDLDAYLFQSKTNTKAYILLFPVANGITVVADFIKN